MRPQAIVVLFTLAIIWASHWVFEGSASSSVFDGTSTQASQQQVEPRAPQVADRGGRDQTIAVVNSFRILELLTETKRFDDEVDDIERRMKAENDEFLEKMNPLVEEGRKLDRNSPEYRALKERADELQKAYDERFRVLREERNQATQRRTIRAAIEAEAAIEVVAARHHFEYVLQTTPIPDVEAKRVDSTTALRHLARGVLVYPKDADITALVRDELGLKAEE